jgi:hypothetical protein
MDHRYIPVRHALLATALALSVPALAWAQAPDPHDAQPERPTVATHAGTVAPGWIEIEFGGELDRYAHRSYGGSTPALAKIGLASHVQLSLFASTVRAPAGSGLGLGDVAVGVKWRLTDDAPVVGRFAVLPILKLPTGSLSAGRGTETTDASLILISSHDLGPVALDLNAGVTHRSGNGANAPTTSTLWTISFGGPAAGRLGWCAELYGYPGTNGPAGSDAIVAFLAGPTFEARRSLVLDAGVIVPLTGPQPHAIYVGATWNIGKLR